MARATLIVPLIAVAVTSGFAQSGSLSASARGGYSFVGSDGQGAGSISGNIRISGALRKADIMFVLKDVGGATLDGQSEVIVFLSSISKSIFVGNKLVVTGTGTFQGESREVEMTFVDSKSPKTADQIRIRVIRSGWVEFDHSAKLDSSTIKIVNQ